MTTTIKLTPYNSLIRETDNTPLVNVVDHLVTLNMTQAEFDACIAGTYGAAVKAYVEALPLGTKINSGFMNRFIRWCIPGRESSGTVFKDVSGRGNDGTIDTLNVATAPAATTVTAASSVDRVCTLSSANHNALPGDFITVSGATPAAYNANRALVTSVVLGASGTITYVAPTAPGAVTTVQPTFTLSRGGPFAVENRMSTVTASGVGGGITTTAAACLCDLSQDSVIMHIDVTNEDPLSSEVLACFGNNVTANGGGAGFYISHRSSAAGVVRVVAHRGNGTVVSGTDSTVKISNPAGTRQVGITVAVDRDGSVYSFVNGVLATSDPLLMTGVNAYSDPIVRVGGHLGGLTLQSTNPGVFRGWQCYVFPGRSLPLNVAQVASKLAESPAIPLLERDFSL